MNNNNYDYTSNRYLEDSYNIFLRNVGTELPVYTVPPPRKPEYETVGPQAGCPDILRGFIKKNAGKVH